MSIVQRDRQVVVAVNLYPLLYVVPAAWCRRSGHVQVVGLVNTAELVGRERRFEAIYAPLLRSCDQIVFGCAGQRDLWVDKYGLSLERSQVIYNGVDTDLFNPDWTDELGQAMRLQLGIPGDAVVVGSVGRLDPEKSFDLLLAAVARLYARGRDVYLMVVGEGNERGRLEHLARDLGVEGRVKLVGLLHDVRPAISAMDIFALPSTAVETFSNAALEAMAMARAVVLSRMGGAAEMVEHGKSGMLFPVGDGTALTKILENLSESADLRRSLGLAARQRVEASFRFRDMVSQYKGLLTLP
jgi:glycosyltransferase involved in cell wall biosynthesis